MTNIPAVLGAALSDILSLLSIGGNSVTGAVAQGAVAAFLRRRAQDAHDILLEEFREARIGRIEFASEDELGGVLFRYFNAIRDNAARLNLRLMAQTITGLARRGGIYADPFNRYAAALACLSRDEVIVLGAMMKPWSAYLAQGGGENCDVHQELLRTLVPGTFETGKHVSAALAAASKSGLLFRMEGGFGPVGFYPSPLLEELVQLADFQEALRREPVTEKRAE